MTMRSTVCPPIGSLRPSATSRAHPSSILFVRLLMQDWNNGLNVGQQLLVGSERRGDTASAKRKVQEVIKTANEKGDRQVLALGLMEYARILMREGDTTLSKQVVDSAKGMATHVKHLPTLISALRVSDQGGILPAVLDKWDAMVGERGEVQRWVEALPIARDRLATS